MNALGIAFDSIWSHRLRSALTALGIVIGVFAVVTLTSLGAAVNSYVSGQFAGLGATILTISPSTPAASGHQGHHFRGGGGGGFGPGGAVPSTLTVADANAILAAHKSAIQSVAPVASLPLPVSLPGQGSTGLSVLGTTRAYFPLEGLAFAHGSYHGSGVVLGSGAAKILFPHVKNPVGRTIMVASSQFTVVAVLSATKGIAAAESSHVVFMDVNQGLKLAGLDKISEIVLRASSNTTVDRADSEATRIMTHRHPTRDFSVTKNSQLLSTVTSTLSTITTFLSGLAAISLLVGGIGIMNIMLVTVAERFREIGIRKAMGARDGDILVQFLAESMLLSLLGGAVGMVLAAIAAGIIGHLAGFAAGLTVNAVILALSFSIVVGAVFGVLPALRAARLMPTDALRTE
jgi:putative ABC transport system permease protein